MKLLHRKIGNKIADDLLDSMCFPEEDTAIMRRTSSRPILKEPSWNDKESEIKIDYKSFDDICNFDL